MITVQEAENLILRQTREIFGGLGSEDHSFKNLDGFVLDEPIRADRDYPPFNRATMDGICVNWESYLGGKREFELSGVCSAGAAQKSLSNPNSAMEIMTGAPLPTGAGLVIPYEDLEIKNSMARVNSVAPRGELENVHLVGSDCKSGDIILPAGTRMNGPRWGIAASFGYADIKGQKLPKIKIISTGDEIVGVDRKPEVYQIRGSNAAALKASLLAFGYPQVDLDHVLDDPQQIRQNYLENTEIYDALIYTGGVSKGKFDYLPKIWEECGVQKHFHHVSQRPGKPLWFGTDSKKRTAVFGLPGNPVSCLICLHRYFLPQKKVYTRLTEEIHFQKSLTLFLPVKMEVRDDGTLTAQPLKIKNSGEFTALAESDGFIELPKDQTHFAKDASFRYFSWTPLGGCS